MKKKTSVNINSISLKGKTSKEEELLRKIFGDDPVDDCINCQENSPNITIEEIYEPNEEYVELKKLDDWCFKILQENPNLSYYENKPRSYTKYHHIERVLIKYGMDYVKELLKKCPLKGVQKGEIIDSLSWVIFIKKIDPTSIIPIPETQSLWDKISEDGYKE